MLNLRLLPALWLAAAGWAYDFSALKPEGYVSDFARVVDAGSKAELERYCGEVARVTGVEIALVTIASLEGEPIEDVANLLYRKWGVGKHGTNEGALLLLSIGDRRSRLEVGYGLEPILPDGSAGALLREMRPALRENHIGDALKLAVREIGGRIEQAKNVRIGTEAPPPRYVARPGRGAPGLTPEFLNLGMGIVMAVLLFGLLGRGSRRRRYGYGTGWLFWLPFLLGGGSRFGGGYRRAGWGSSHGGFGGYDSGDSFGGFGGGDSGGGGASSSW